MEVLISITINCLGSVHYLQAIVSFELDVMV